MTVAHGHETIGERLLRILAERRWSLGRLHRETLTRGSVVSLSQLSLLTRNEIEQPRLSTIGRICAALDVPPTALLGAGPLQERIEKIYPRPLGYTTDVAVVRLVRGGGLVLTGETIGVAASLLEGRERLLAAEIESGGMGPYILLGDRVVFDPDRSPEHRQVALLLHGEVAMCAWYVVRDAEASLRFADGSSLRPDQVTICGTVVHILRSPPDYLP